MKKPLILVSCFLLSLSSIPCHADLVVIGNASSNFNSLTQSKILNYWLGRIKKLPNGEIASIVDQEKDSSARNIFYKKVVKKNTQQLKAYWAKKSFTRKGYPPQEVANDKAVVDWVSSHGGGLGYVDETAVNNSVKILYKLD